MKIHYIKPGFIHLSAITMMAFTTQPVAADKIDVEERALDADQVTRFEAQAVEGDFKILSHDENKVLLKITREVKDVDDGKAELILAALKTDFDADGGTIHLREDHPGNPREWKEAAGLRNADYEILYELWMPPTIDLDVTTVEGDVLIGEMAGKCEVTTTEGDVLVEEAGGLARIKSTEGDVLIKKVSGPAQVSTVEGDVIIVESTSFQVQSVEGDVMVELSGQPSGNCSLNTVEGDINLDLPQEAAITIVAQSLSGKVNLVLPLDNQVTNGGQTVGTRNGGGPSIQLSSIEGDIGIK